MANVVFTKISGNYSNKINWERVFDEKEVGQKTLDELKDELYWEVYDNVYTGANGWTDMEDFVISDASDEDIADIVAKL